MDEKDGPSQINALIYAMGERADDIFSTFTLTEDQGKDYEVVVEKFEIYFVKKQTSALELHGRHVFDYTLSHVAGHADNSKNSQLR